MKILHVIPSFSLEAGGVAQGVRSLTKFYAQENVSATVVCMDDPEDNLGEAEHLEVIALGKGKGVFSYHSGLVDWIKRNASEFDAVVIEGLWQYHGVAVYKALRNNSIPYYVFTHGMLDPWFKHTYPLKHLKKYLFWLFAQYAVLKNARAVLFTCEEEKFLARESFKPYQIREEVVGYGTSITDIARLASADDFYKLYPELLGKRIFLFLSRIHEKKGCDLLIEAFAKVAHQSNDLHLVMAGPDQTGWQIDLEKMANDLGISDRITWTGMLKDEKKWGAIKVAEAFILPSHQENFGIAVAEALAVGTPVLISNKVNIWREIEEMHAGLVSSDTLDGTEALFNQWLELDNATKSNMKENAINCFTSKFDMQQASKNLIALIIKDLKGI